MLFRGSFLLSFPDFTDAGKDSAYFGSAKRQTPPSQRGRECQLKPCNSQASDNRFSMTSASLSTESVCEEKDCLLKSGKDKATHTGKIPLSDNFYGIRGVVRWQAVGRSVCLPF